MNTFGLSILVRMGNCFCLKESVKINGHTYIIRQHLGEGGFSVVDLVEDSTTHKLYALKRITCHSLEDQKVALAEVEYHKVLEHSSIIECIDSDLVGVPDMIGNTTSEVLILLPYYQRGTLHDELMKQQKMKRHFEEMTILMMFRRICEGVQHMHSAKPHPLAHRDLKVGNILLKDDLSPVIMDLGSVAKGRVQIKNTSEARVLLDQAAERSSMPYRAPELFHVESHCSVDERTDVWSLGCLLYAMCFYKSPFDSVYERGDSVALAVVGGNVHFPESHPFSQNLVDLILSLLKVNPEERPFIDWTLNSVDELIHKASGTV